MRAAITFKVNPDVMKERAAVTGFDVKTMAEKSGLSQMTVTRALAGASIKPPTLKALADALGVSPLELAASGRAPREQPRDRPRFELGHFCPY